jgi:LemA protein
VLAQDGKQREFKIMKSKIALTSYKLSRTKIKNTNTMKKIILAAVVAMFSLTSCGTYNGMVEQEEAVKSAWSNVETQYQRRADLIPNLVSTVKGYASHEESTLTAVVDARAKATSINVSLDELNEQTIAEYQKAQSAVSSALGRLIAVSENYPDLKANQNFLELQAQLEGTENRITVARKEFNDATQQYNVAVRRFPANLVAMIFGFDQKAYFEADASAATAPKVEF